MSCIDGVNIVIGMCVCLLKFQLLRANYIRALGNLTSKATINDTRLPTKFMDLCVDCKIDGMGDASTL